MKDTTLSIGRFSQLTGLTTRALRLYGELGLLPPHAVDAESGYRSYTSDQISDANLISRLRAIDMPLDEVGLFLGGDILARQRSLAAHRVRLVERRDTATWAISTIDRMERTLTNAEPAERFRLTSMVRQALWDQPVLRIQLTLEQEDLQPVGMPECEQPGRDQPRDWRTCIVLKHASVGEVQAIVDRQNLVLAGPPYISCSEPDAEGTIDAEIGLPVDRAGTADGRVTAGVLPGGEVAVNMYTGPATGIGVAYRQLWTDIVSAGLSPAGPPRELLMTNPAWDPDPEHNWAHLVWPVSG